MSTKLLLIKNANNDLPTLEEKYQKLKRGVDSISKADCQKVTYPIGAGKNLNFHCANYI